MSSHRAPIRCVCCNKIGRHAGRGLIVSCHSRHTRNGTLGQYPPIAGSPEWQATHRPAQEIDLAEAEGSWQERGACRSVDPEIFWPPTNTPLVLERYLAQAGPVCVRCPVRAECLDYALSTGQHDGIWGGTTSAERRRLQLRQAERATA